MSSLAQVEPDHLVGKLLLSSRFRCLRIALSSQTAAGMHGMLVSLSAYFYDASMLDAAASMLHHVKREHRAIEHEGMDFSRQVR